MGQIRSQISTSVSFVAVSLLACAAVACTSTSTAPGSSNGSTTSPDSATSSGSVTGNEGGSTGSDGTNAGTDGAGSDGDAGTADDDSSTADGNSGGSGGTDADDDGGGSGGTDLDASTGDGGSDSTEGSSTDADTSSGGSGAGGDGGTGTGGGSATASGGASGGASTTDTASETSSGGSGGTAPDDPCADKLGESDCPAASCADLLSAGVDENGLYWIDPSGTEPFEIYCDQTTDGGGWGLVWTNHGGAQGASRSNEAVLEQTGALVVMPPELALTSAKHEAAFNYYFARPGLEWLKRGLLWDADATIVRRIAFRLDMGETSLHDVFATEDVDLNGELDDSVLLMEQGVCHRMASPIEVFVEGQSLGQTDWVFRYEDAAGAYGLAHTGPNVSPSSGCGEDLETSTNLIRTNDVLPSGNTLSTLRLTGHGSGTVNSLLSYQHTESGRDASRCFFECWDDDTTYTDAFVWGVR